MNDSILFSADGPGLHLMAIDESPLSDLMIGWTETQPECAIRRIRGHKSVDESRFFDEIAAALQFPYYFGENWDAVWECITDLSWIPQASFLLIMDRAGQLLHNSERGFSILMKIITDANEYWRGQRGDIGGEVQPVRLQGLLACSNEALPHLENRLVATRVPFSRL